MTYKQASRVVVPICLILILFISCDKNTEPPEPRNPQIEADVPGIYVRGNFYWKKPEINRIIQGGDDNVKVKVQYLGGTTIKLEYITTSPYPAQKVYKLQLKDSTGTDPQRRYYHFAQTLEATSSIITGDLIVPISGNSAASLRVWHKTSTFINGREVHPLLVTSILFRI